MQHGDQREQRTEKEPRCRGHEAPLLPYQGRESAQHELGYAVPLAAAVAVEGVVAAQRQLVQPVDERWAVAAVGSEGEALAQAAVAGGHFLRRKGLGFWTLEKILQRAPL